MSTLLQLTSKAAAVLLNAAITEELLAIELEYGAENPQEVWAEPYQTLNPLVPYWLLPDPRVVFPEHTARLNVAMDAAAASYQTKTLPYEYEYPEEIIELYRSFREDVDLSIDFPNFQEPREEPTDGKEELKAFLSFGNAVVNACDAFKIFTKDKEDNYLIGVSEILDNFPVRDVCYALGAYKMYPEFYEELKEKCRVIAGEYVVENEDSSKMLHDSYLKHYQSASDNGERAVINEYWRQQIQLACRVDP